MRKVAMDTTVTFRRWTPEWPAAANAPPQSLEEDAAGRADKTQSTVGSGSHPLTGMPSRTRWISTLPARRARNAWRRRSRRRVLFLGLAVFDARLSGVAWLACQV
jgi:hypothetical protein